MKKLKIVTLVCLSIFFAISCSKEDASTTTQSEQNVSNAEALKTTNSNNNFQSLFERKEYTIPTNFKQSLRQSSKSENLQLPSSETVSDFVINKDQEYWSDYIKSVINPDEFSCDETDGDSLTAYLDASSEAWTLREFIIIFFYGNYPLYDAVFFKDPNEKQVFGSEGQFTNDIYRTFKDLKRFWDINSKSIGIVSMKGNTFADVDRMLQIEALANPGFDEEIERQRFTNLAEFMMGETFNNYKHPILSLNAFALSTDDPTVGKRIVMGDGILDSYEYIGYGDVAPHAILAHEFAHQIQFENNYFEENVSEEDEPAATRRTELMADAYATYYLTHKRGATMNWKRVQQFLNIFFIIGDCGFDNSGHHGTHQQRLAAAKFGYEIAKSEQKKGHIMPAHDFYQLFENALDSIINCDDCVAD